MFESLTEALEPHAILGGVYCFGQFAIGGLAVSLLLAPAFGLPVAAGSIIEMSFAGGHGTIAVADLPRLPDPHRALRRMERDGSALAGAAFPGSP